jgi:hypothetical protein
MKDHPNPDLEQALDFALRALSNARPSPLIKALEFVAATHELELGKNSISQIANHLETCGPNDRMLDVLARAIHAWDHRDGSWVEATLPHSEARRTLILTKLGFSEGQQRILNNRVPRVTESELPIVIAKEHEPWYEESGRRRGSFYWDHYTKQLLPPYGKWKPKDVELLGLSIDDVIARLSDPCRSELYAVKGLVMGYVQSGKTSHFSGLIAKAGDSGYRLIIVLAGTLDILRKQTQRRIDKEIVGRELLTEEEYGQDVDWLSFVSHGGRPSHEGAFDWERLTNSDDDYKSLKRRLGLLEFRVSDRNKAFNDLTNLRVSSAKLAIIKKTPSRLKQLCDDLEGLKELRNKLEHVPTLIIDDESDQASINTVDEIMPSGERKRTGTNKAIGRLLSLLPRAQYVGYTATPFANVFIDPEDAEDLFPKDFIISLRRPDGYMGVSDFYDFNNDFDEGDYRGNRNAFVREVEGENEAPKNLSKAVDAFVLAGAIKLFREHRDPAAYQFRHHTMLVHHAATQVVHDADKEVVERIFREGARYQATVGLEKLKALFESDFAPVSKVREPNAPFPSSFEKLKPFISQCITKLCADKSVRIVNGDGRHRDETPDFDAYPVWAILVGGTKLSRGYTVEGLTVSYYRRPTGAGDTLMQMGRWFGFRSGYMDLVRLFIGRKEKKGNTVVDLYEAFGAVCRDEEALREDLRKYAGEGLKPWQVPPLVQQHLPELPPTSRNKRFNAEIKSLDYAGDWTEKTSAPVVEAQMSANLYRANALLGSSAVGSEELIEFENESGEKRKFVARLGSATGEAVLGFLKSYTWAEGRKPLTLEIDYITRALNQQTLERWTLLLPQIAGGKARPYDVPGIGPISVISRARVSKSRFGVYSEPRHVEAAKAMAGVNKVAKSSRALKRAMNPTSAVLVLYYVVEKNCTPAPITVGFGIQYPGRKQKSPIQWGARRGDREGDVVVSEELPPKPRRPRVRRSPK